MRQTRIRVIAALDELRRRGFTKGRVLDLGSLYGAFALPFRRLGYEVTAVDRYRDYPGLESVTRLLTAAGARIVATTRADELAVLESLAPTTCDQHGGHQAYSHTPPPCFSKRCARTSGQADC